MTHKYSTSSHQSGNVAKWLARISVQVVRESSEQPSPSAEHGRRPSKSSHSPPMALSSSTRKGVKAKDVNSQSTACARLLMRTASRAHLVLNMAKPSLRELIWPCDQHLVLVETELLSLDFGPDFGLNLTVRSGFSYEIPIAEPRNVYVLHQAPGTGVQVLHPSV